MLFWLGCFNIIYKLLLLCFIEMNDFLNDLQLMEYTQLCKLPTFLFLFCVLVVASCLLGDSVPSKTFCVLCF